MTLVKSDQYIPEAKVSKVTKSGIRVISEMSTIRILGHVAHKHRVGLLTGGNLLAWGLVFHVDKVVRLFI